jgi:hypothetical protein
LFCGNTDVCDAGIWLGDGETVEVDAAAALAAGVGNETVSDGIGDGDFSSSWLGDGDAVFFFTLTGEAEGDRFFLDFFFRWGVGVGVETIRLPLSPIDCSAASIDVTVDVMKAARINTRKNMVSSSV